MNIDQLRKELEVDEGVKYEIYNDHLGILLLGLAIWLSILIQNMEKRLEHLSQKIELQRHLIKMLQQ